MIPSEVLTDVVMRELRALRATVTNSDTRVVEVPTPVPVVRYIDRPVVTQTIERVEVPSLPTSMTPAALASFITALSNGQSSYLAQALAALSDLTPTLLADALSQADLGSVSEQPAEIIDPPVICLHDISNSASSIQFCVYDWSDFVDVVSNRVAQPADYALFGGVCRADNQLPTLGFTQTLLQLVIGGDEDAFLEELFNSYSIGGLDGPFSGDDDDPRYILGATLPLDEEVKT